MSIASIPRLIPILSGKGGVGKSSVTVQLALTLSLLGYNVGVLDIDLTGPSIPRLFGIESAKIRQAPGGWLPVQVHERGEEQTADGPVSRGALHCMSLGFLLHDRGDAVIWRGPKKTAMVKQLLSDVLWPRDLDYLLIDTPPGTSDEHISLMTNLMDPARISPSQKLGAVIVTTPQAISTSDVKKELSFCQKINLNVLGVVENMAGYVCPCCGETTDVFSKGGGEIMAREWAVAFLGRAPIDGEGWGMLIEEGKTPVYQSAEGNGNGTSNGEETSNGTTSKQTPVERDPGRLAIQYTRCSLYPVFKSIVDKLLPFNASLPVQPNADGG
ncbi:MAG: hypothetical protein Q9159_002668 [Coniocarpon cinnabarinum]